MSVKTKIFGFASAVVVFAGMAYGQPALNCGTTGTGPSGLPNPGAAGINPSNPISLRAEGTTELVSDTITPCAGAPVGLAGAAGNVLVAMTGPTGLLGVTSKDAYVLIIDPTGVHAPVAYGPGVVTGLTVSFGTAGTPVIFPAYNFNIQVSNVRVDVSGAFPAPTPLAVNETVFAGALGISSLFPAVPQIVGYIRNGLQVTGPGSLTNFPICVGQTLSSAFTVTVSELFAGAFKVGGVSAAGLGGTLLPVSPQTLPNFVGNNPNVPGSESGSLVAGTLLTGPNGNTAVPGVAATVGVATSGTRIKFVFAGIPANVTLSIPTTLTSGANLNMTLTSSETGAFSAVGTAGTIVPLTATGGVATAIYEVNVANLTVIKSATLTAYVTYLANVPIAPSGPITVTTSYSPSPATPGTAVPPVPVPPTVPYFLNNGTPLNGSMFTVCQTTLLFPFITNQQGFETGIAIANAGLDNLGPTATSPYGGKSVASGQSGACTFYFYGSAGAEGGAQLATSAAANFPSATNKPTTTIAPGTTHADTLTDIIGGSFQGYAIAVCPFLYARGFAFVEYGLETSVGLVEGYLADVLNSNRTSAISANATVLPNFPEVSGH